MQASSFSSPSASRTRRPPQRRASSAIDALSRPALAPDGSAGYRLKIDLGVCSGFEFQRIQVSAYTRASRMSELVDGAITGLAAPGGCAVFLEILRRWHQRRQEKRQEQLQLDIRILGESHALRQKA